MEHEEVGILHVELYRCDVFYADAGAFARVLYEELLLQKFNLRALAWRYAPIQQFGHVAFEVDFFLTELDLHLLTVGVFRGAGLDCLHHREVEFTEEIVGLPFNNVLQFLDSS